MIKGIPHNLSIAGDGTTTISKIKTGDMGTQIGQIMTPQSKAEHTVVIKGIPTDMGMAGIQQDSYKNIENHTGNMGTDIGHINTPSEGIPSGIQAAGSGNSYVSSGDNIEDPSVVILPGLPLMDL
jgi:hypothetical protein